MAWPTECSRINLLGGGVPIWGLKRLRLLLPLPDSHEAAKPGQTHWMMSNTDPHHPITPASSHQCARPSQMPSHAEQVLPASAMLTQGSRSTWQPQTREHVGSLYLGSFAVVYYAQKLTGTPLPQGESQQRAPCQEGQATRLTGMRLAEAAGNLQPTFPQGGSPPSKTGHLLVSTARA